MGAWGYGPLDNDTALDLRDVMCDKIASYLDSNDPDERRAAAQMLIDLGDIHHDEQVIYKLNQILTDYCWIESWDDSEKAVKEVENQIKLFEERDE